MRKPRFMFGRLGRNALLTAGGLSARAVIQAAYLIVLSRWMGPEGYGLFAGSVAAAILIAPMSGWGIAYVLSRRLAQGRSGLPGLWANAIVQIVVSGSLLCCLFVAASSLMFAERMHLGPMLLLGLSELIALPMAQAATSISLAVDRGISAALAVCLVPLFRLLLVLLGLAAGVQGQPECVALLHFAGALVGALAAAGLVWRIDGAPSWRAMLPLGTTAREGTRYALGTTVGIGYQEIDKVLLLQVLGATATGTYTAAFRVISVLVLPLYALMSAALPRLFAIHGSPEGRRMLKAITMAAVAYGLAAPMVAILIAPFMPKIFGQGFSDSTTYLLMLAPWVLPFALHQVAALGLTASGWQFQRVIIEAAGLVVVVALNVLLLPGVGPSGAIVALLVAETLMAVACWLLLRRLRRVT